MQKIDFPKNSENNIDNYNINKIFDTCTFVSKQ